MDIAALLLESVLPLAVYVLPVLIPVIIVLRLFRFKDVVVKLMDEVRRNPDIYKNNPEAVKALLGKMQRTSRNPGGVVAKAGQKPGQPANSSSVKRSSSVPSSRGGGGVLPSGRDLRTVKPSKYSTPLRGTSRMTQSRQEHKLKTTVAVLLLLGGVTMLFSTYFYGYQYEPFIGGIVLMVAGLYLLKTDVERV